MPTVCEPWPGKSHATPLPMDAEWYENAVWSLRTRARWPLLLRRGLHRRRVLREVALDRVEVELAQDRRVRLAIEQELDRAAEQIVYVAAAIALEVRGGHAYHVRRLRRRRDRHVRDPAATRVAVGDLDPARCHQRSVITRSGWPYSTGAPPAPRTSRTSQSAAAPT